MRWAEISIEVSCGAAEAAATIASDYSPAGVAVLGPMLVQESALDNGLSDVELAGIEIKSDAVVRFYAPDDEKELASMLSEMRKRLENEVNCSCQGKGVIGISVRMADESEWSGWKQNFKPFRLGSRIVVSPTWEDAHPLPGDIVIKIDPGQAFGTGQHATTASCVAMLERHIKGGESVLDVGTGTGILAIASAGLGASKVVAVDIDQVAVMCASSNVSANGAEARVKVSRGDLLKGQPGSFDVIVANILADPIMEMAEGAFGILAGGGTFISSGYISRLEPEVRSALERAGFAIADRIQEEDWVCLAARKPRA